MRYLITEQHRELHTQWREAYARHDAFAEAGDDGVQFGGSTKSDEASAAEYAALDAFLLSPAVTTIELQTKIAVMRSRGPLAPDCLIWREDAMKAMLDRLERDLVEMARPSCSPKITEAFDAWAEAHRTNCEEAEGNDERDNARSKAVLNAFARVMSLPCVTPGDFIAKRYIEALNEAGPANEGGQVTFPFLIDTAQLGGGGIMESHAEHAQYRDIRDSDLGCCMLALGRVDFDAAEWIAAARRIGSPAIVTLIGIDSRTFTLSLEGEGDLAELLLRLTANGLGIVAQDRCRAIADEIEANHPDLVVDAREPAEA